MKTFQSKHRFPLSVAYSLRSYVISRQFSQIQSKQSLQLADLTTTNLLVEVESELLVLAMAQLQPCEKMHCQVVIDDTSHNPNFRMKSADRHSAASYLVPMINHAFKATEHDINFHDTNLSLLPFITMSSDEQDAEIGDDIQTFLKEYDVWIKNENNDNEFIDDNFSLYESFKCRTRSEIIESDESTTSYSMEYDLKNDDPWINNFINALKMDQFESFNKKIMQINSDSPNFCQII